MDFVNKQFLNQLLANIVAKDNEDQEYDVPDATVAYLRFLVQPYFDAMKNIDSIENISIWLNQVFSDELLGHIQADLEKEDNTQTLVNVKTSIITTLLDTILVDTFEIDNYVTIFTPWDIKSALQNSDAYEEFFLGKFFNIPTSDKDPELPVTVDINNNTFVHNMTYQLVLGITTFYHTMNIRSPLSVFGHEVPIYFDHQQGIERIKMDDNRDYSVDIRDVTYYFNDKEFFRGLLTAARWLNVNPHDYIINLIGRKYSLGAGDQGPVITAIPLIYK